MRTFKHSTVGVDAPMIPSRAVRQSLRQVMLVAAVALVALLPPRPSAMADGEIEPAIRASRFILTTHTGRTVTDEHFRGRHLLVLFGYTFCPDVCPTGLQVISGALDLLGDKAERVQPLFITVDPERDTVAVLADYVAGFHPRIIALTGPAVMIERVARDYRVRFERAASPAGGKDDYLIDHTATIFHIGPDGRQLGRFSYVSTPDEIAAGLRESFR